MIFVVVAIVLGVTLSPRSSQSGTTPSTTLDPTPAPTSLQRDSVISLIQSRIASTSFSNASSPQNQALDWILTDPYSSYELSDDRLVQRFALATFYYSTDGDEWTNHDVDQWLNSTNECLWDANNIFCSPASAVQGLDLDLSYGLLGRIPIELGPLTQISRLDLSTNQLTGSLPSELGLLTQLSELFLEDNQLTGSLPSELGLMTQLVFFFLSNNKFKGSIPSSLVVLPVLIFILIAEERLSVVRVATMRN